MSFAKKISLVVLLAVMAWSSTGCDWVGLLNSWVEQNLAVAERDRNQGQMYLAQGREADGNAHKANAEAGEATARAFVIVCVGLSVVVLVSSVAYRVANGRRPAPVYNSHQIDAPRWQTVPGLQLPPGQALVPVHFPVGASNLWVNDDLEGAIRLAVAGKNQSQIQMIYAYLYTEAVNQGFEAEFREAWDAVMATDRAVVVMRQNVRRAV